MNPAHRSTRPTEQLQLAYVWKSAVVELMGLIARLATPPRETIILPSRASVQLWQEALEEAHSAID